MQQGKLYRSGITEILIAMQAKKYLVKMHGWNRFNKMLGKKGHRNKEGLVQYSN